MPSALRSATVAFRILAKARSRARSSVGGCFIVMTADPRGSAIWIARTVLSVFLGPHAGQIKRPHARSRLPSGVSQWPVGVGHELAFVIGACSKRCCRHG